MRREYKYHTRYYYDDQFYGPRKRSYKRNFSKEKPT